MIEGVFCMPSAHGTYHLWINRIPVFSGCYFEVPKESVLLALTKCLWRVVELIISLLMFCFIMHWAYLGTTSKKKSKKQDFGPLSVDPYPPTIKREVLIRDNFDFFLPPTLLIEKGTFLKKNSAPKHIYSNFKRDKIGVKIIFHPFHLNLLSRGHNNGNKM